MNSSISVIRIQATVPPEPGGMEQHVRRLTDEQRRLGHRVRLFFLAGDASHRDDQMVGLRWFARLRPQSLRSLLLLASMFHRLFLVRGAHVVHVHGDWSMALTGYLAKKLTRAPILMLSVHDGVADSRIRQWLQRRTFRLADLVHTTGRRESEEISKFVDSPVLWQPSGISAAFLEPASTHCQQVRVGIEHLVITTALLRRKKNVDLVLDIAAMLPNTRFIVFGDGPERRRLEARIESDGLINVHLRGRVDPDEIRRWLDMADAYLSTSFVEGTPTAMLEAMARGVPIVTSRSGDFSGILEDGVTGYIIDSFDAPKYVSALRVVTRGSPHWDLMHVSCIERARCFSWPMTAAAITAATLKALPARGGIS